MFRCRHLFAVTSMFLFASSQAFSQGFTAQMADPAVLTSPAYALESSVSDIRPVSANFPVNGVYNNAGCNSCYAANEPYRLLDKDNAWGLDFDGWINGGIMLNTNNNLSSRNDPVPFSNPAGEFLGNQLWLGLGKQVDTGGCGWDWGFRWDALWGADGPDTQAFGDGSWDFGWNSAGEYGVAIPQLYAEIGYNNLKVKLGHFFTIMGYEVVQAPGNFFYSHAYTMAFGEPFTHTGALAEYTTAGGATLWAGYTTGWDGGFDNLNNANTFLGGFSTDIGDFTTLTYTVNAGKYGNGVGPAGNLGDIFMHSLVVDIHLTERLDYVLLHDLGINDGGSNVFVGLPPANAEWYGITQYLFYTINDQWQFGTRFEWFDDSDGLRISTVNNGDNDLNFWALTFGVNYKPTPNFIIRPEFRFDWCTSHREKNSGGPDFNDIYINNTKDNIQLFGIDFIATF